MWDFFETVRRRHSIRRYQTDMPVEAAKLHAVLEMASAAPSAGDLQAYKIIAVQETGLKTQLQQAAENQSFIAEAPVLLVFCADSDRSAEKFGPRGASLYALQDATIAATYAQLAAVAAGMGSTWIGRFDEIVVSRALNLTAGIKPVAMLCIGYPAELPADTTRRHLDELVSHR